MLGISWGNLLFGFAGRINRAKWWLVVLISVLIQLVAAGLGMAVQNDSFAIVLAVGYWVLLLWISLAAGSKRLHDLDRTAAWLVVFFVGPLLLLLAGFVIAGASFDELAGEELDIDEIIQLGGIGLIFSALWIGLAIWALVWFGCLRGTQGPNRYGPDPLQPGPLSAPA